MYGSIVAHSTKLWFNITITLTFRLKSLFLERPDKKKH